MVKRCISTLCFLLAKNVSDNITHELDQIERRKIAELRKAWSGDENSTDVLALSNVFVNALGDVSTCDGRRVTRPFGSHGCRRDGFGGDCGAPAPLHDRVIVVSQRWGNNFFHALVEGLPRLVAALDSLPPPADAREREQERQMQEKQKARYGKRARD